MKFNVRKNVFGLVALFLGVAATLMLFLPALIDIDSEAVYSGAQSVFGAQIYDLGPLGTVQIEPSFLGIAAFLLPALAGLIALLSKKWTIVSAALFIGATILLFLLPTYTKTTLTLLGNTSVYETTWAMGWGLISAGVLSILGVFVSLYVFMMSLRSE